MSKVYFLHAPSIGLLKIGRSSNPVKRIAAIREISPVEFDLIGVAGGDSRLEAKLHRQFVHLRRRGEWFEATPELLSYARLHCIMDLWIGLTPEMRAEALITLQGSDWGDA